MRRHRSVSTCLSALRRLLPLALAGLVLAAPALGWGDEAPGPLPESEGPGEGTEPHLGATADLSHSARIPLSQAHATTSIPYFARRYGLECSRCHVSPPKLNEFGEEFVRRNYRLPGAPREPRSTIPFAIWASARTDVTPGQPGMERRARSYVNRVEVVSGGSLGLPWLSYFVEWRPVSFELQADGGLRDRSGRFEDLFLIAERGPFELSVGQFRQVQQVDISRRLGVSEPGFFSRSLTGEGPGSDRQVALRAFSLSGRSPSVRAGWIREVGTRWEWTTYASVPFPGELTLPLTREARSNASFEFESDPKGVFLESFLRRGIMSYGAHLFVDPGDRYQWGAVAAGRRDAWMWTGAGGGVRDLNGSVRGRWSGEIERILAPSATLGVRGEGQAGADPAWIGYGNFHFPGTTWTLRLTLEQRLQAGRGVTLVELGAIF